MGFANAGVIQDRFTRAHAFGLIEGLADDVVGQVYLERMLEPTLNVFSDKLEATPGGPQDPERLRASALAATAPLFMLVVHQYLLGGHKTVPINLDRTISHLQDLLVQAFRATEEQSPLLKRIA